ncbi:hypothetical protein ACTXG6_42835 [Pseudonocardia sp. Cha107L01]|uniref:hypothetical protein n=1 Tax=Pseudonocardia sp. Cha107L01 TaxID=3457576 RepID=UPI00403E828B
MTITPGPGGLGAGSLGCEGAATRSPAIPRRARPLRTLLVGVPLAGASLLWLAPELLGQGSVSPFAQLVAFRPVGAAGQLLLAALAGLFRRRYWPAALAVGGVAAVGTVLPRTVTGPTPPPGRELSVLSFNLLHGRADVAALAERPDVVVMPEAGEGFRSRLDPLLDGLGYRSWATTGPGERDGMGIVMLAGARLGAVTTTPLDVGGRFRWMRLSGGVLGEVGVVAVHTATPVRMDARLGRGPGAAAHLARPGRRPARGGGRRERHPGPRGAAGGDRRRPGRRR